jgi:O-antigen/teichoic acid export membrane protein
MGLLRAGTITLASRIAVFFISLATNVVLARALGPGGRGLYALALILPSVLVLAANLGVGNALTYYVARRTYDLTAIIGQAISLALMLGAGTFIFLVAFMRLFGAHVLPGVPDSLVLLAGVSLPLGLFFYYCLAVMQGTEDFWAFNGLYVINAVAVLVLLIGLVFVPRSVMVAVLAWSLSWVPTAAVGLYWLSRRGRPNLRFDWQISKSLLRFGIVGYLSLLTNFFNFRLGIFLVNIFRNAAQVGLYTVAVSLAETIFYVSTSAATVLAPRVAASDVGEGDVATGRVSRMVLVISLGAAVALGVTAPVLIRILFGPSFEPSVVAVWLLLPGIVTFSVARVLSSYLLGRNKQHIDFMAALAGLVLTVALDLALIPRYGFAGAAAASSFAYTATLLVNLRWVVRNSTLSVGDLLLPRIDDVRTIISRLPTLAGAR